MRRSNPVSALQRGTYSAYGEKLDWCYYDQIVLAATTAPLSFFSVGLGGAKTKDFTNFTGNGAFPQSQKMKVRALQFTFLGSAAKATADINTLYLALNQMYCEFRIGNKSPVWENNIGSAFGAPIYWTVTPTAAGDNINFQSQGRYTGIVVLNVPITLAALTPFKIDVTPATAPAAAVAGSWLRIGMLGILDRLS